MTENASSFKINQEPSSHVKISDYKTALQIFYGHIHLCTNVQGGPGEGYHSDQSTPPWGDGSDLY